MAIRKYQGDPTCVFEVLPDDVFNELIPKMKKDVVNLMLVSKCMNAACLKAQLGWKQLLPENYQWVQNPCAVVKEAWKEEHKIKRDTYRAESEYVLHDNDNPFCKTLSGQPRYLLEVLDRIISLSPWKADDSKSTTKSTTTPSEIARWVAIEMVLTNAIEPAAGVNAHKTSSGYGMRSALMRSALWLIGGMALLAKDYFSSKLFRTLSRKGDLVCSLFTLFKSRNHIPDYHLNDTKWKELARFVLENQYKLHLWSREGVLEQFKTWFGSELQDLSIEYRIFGETGLIAVHGGIGWSAMKVEWARFLYQERKPKQGPGSGMEIPLSYLRWLVRVSKYVFHDAGQLVRFVLSVVQKGNKELLLRDGGDTVYVDEFLADFEGRLKAVVECVVSDDDTPFCSTSEYEEDHDFVYGRLSLYLIEQFFYFSV